MKMLALAILLMSFPWIGNAKGWGGGHHDSHYHQSYGFWQDVEKRRYRQHIRIDKGIENGRLTRREIKALAREQKHITKQIKHYKHHRNMSYADKKSVMRHIDHYSEQIADLKHNDHFARRDRHNHRAYRHHNNNDYRNDRRLSWVSNDYSAGLYFRF
jgi:hypothetical protein